MIKYYYKLIIREHGKSWYRNGHYHREDGPAKESYIGSKYWCYNGELHRIGGPAIEYKNGDKEWWVYGLKHRDDGPAEELSWRMDQN